VLDALEAILAAEFAVVRASDGEQALAVLERQDVAVVLTDHRMPGMTGVELLRRSQAIAPDAIRMVLTAYTDVDSLIEAINTGRIYHFIPKPWDPNELLVVVRRATERYELARENARLKDELELACNAMQRDAAAARERPLSLEKLVGAQSGLRAAVELARRVLDSDTTVLLLGETGTGKELFARLIHGNGPRRTARFVAQNCGALAESLLESELFGHARGAFTGATGERKGLFEEADGGTIFLDEVDSDAAPTASSAAGR
jgi:two-component system, NtrC family, response regulator HupR/HoxA